MDQSSAIILSLPDEILLEILSRLPLNDLTSVPFVCRRFSNPHFLRHRLIPTLHVFGRSRDGDEVFDSLISVSMPLNSSIWFTPIRQTLPLHRSQNYSFVSLGRSVYIISHQHAFCHDTWTQTTVPIASPPFAKDASVINGKLYASIVVDHVTIIKEYDPVVDEWRVVCWCLDSAGSVGVGVGGVFYLLNDWDDGFTKGYDVSERQWVGDLPLPEPKPSQVCCACGTPAGHLYMVSRHMEELWFWRWEGIGEEWITLEPPVVPYTGPRTLSFRCVAVRDERVVLAVSAVHFDNEDPFYSGMFILVYSVVDGSWSRGPDLPFEFNSDLYVAFTEY